MRKAKLYIVPGDYRKKGIRRFNRVFLADGTEIPCVMRLEGVQDPGCSLRVTLEVQPAEVITTMRRPPRRQQ